MIHKITIPERISFTINSFLQAQILYYMTKNLSIRIVLCDYVINVTPNKIVLESGGEFEVLCSQKWITVMRVLNNVSLDTKELILRALRNCPSKLLLIIDVVLNMCHCDIIFTILDMMFDESIF